MGSKTLSYSGSWQKWAVPAGVKSVRVVLNGAGSDGIAGGRVTGTIAVSKGQVLWFLTGQQGRNPSTTTPGGVSVGGGGAGGPGHRVPGTGGGGATVARLNGSSGTVLGVAAGAGGTSGDGGSGGQGGASIGENGYPGSAADHLLRLAGEGNSTGGTQIQGGNGGTSGLDPALDGQNATDAILAPAGNGGGDTGPQTYGGGGGGGGYHPGGGGQGGVRAAAPAGGGAGGSNFHGGLSSYTTSQGAGSKTGGSVELSWTDPSPSNQPPSPPTEVKANGVDATEDEHVTRSTGTLTITAKVDDPSPGQTVRLVVLYSASSDFSTGVTTVLGTVVAQTHRSSAKLSGLKQDTRYWARLYTRDSRGLQSTNYTSINFWTNRAPLEPTLTTPSENATISQLDSVVFAWTHNDPDPDSVQSRFRLRWRTAGTALLVPGAWTDVTFATSFETYVANPGTFTGNTIYEWQVRTTDAEGAEGPWSAPNSFYVTGPSLFPLLLSPARDAAVNVSTPTLFAWKFRDPDQGDAQARADIRWRTVGAQDWTTRIGTLTVPGGVMEWLVPAGTFGPGARYEWQVRTQDTLTSAVSDWSPSETFWGTVAPGSAVTGSVIPRAFDSPQMLGCGHNRVFVYRKGGTHLVGEITPLVDVTWRRVRDDLSNILLHTNGWGVDCGRMLADIHTWTHELVVFRDGKRVAEGPITRIEDSANGLEIEAKDVMAWLYRRIMRQGYNDAYRVVNGVELGNYTVVERALLIALNALAPDDPNVIPYLTTFDFPDDAGQSRVVEDFAKTAYEEIDDMAATAGLDYTTVGRRIMFWDTHRPIGRLPEMRTGNFTAPPVITEYGMQLATTYGVTNNNGIYGLAERGPEPYGLVELLASAYGETQTPAAGSEEVLTSAARLALQQTLTSQAVRGIGPRFPAPVVVRVPDGTAVTPETPIDINHLVPGVWVPLRAEGTLRTIAQWQKLDLVEVNETSTSAEQVRVTFSPAPNGGADPDADPLTEDA